MRIFKTRIFAKWADKERLDDDSLKMVIREMEQGLIDAELGGNVYKKRVGLQGRGKSSGVRTLIAFKIEERSFFIYGFAKNDRTNIQADELKALKAYAKELFGYSDLALDKAIETKILIEVNNNE